MKENHEMKHILAVDDSESMRQVVALTLKMAGYDATVATDGEKALAMAQKNHYDLVLTDVNMPNMNGIELIRALRALPGYKTTPILTLTTERELPRRQEGKAAGATGWIVKPFLPDKLIATLQRTLA
jgi:two-component system chemotaxis response regulator CheY